MANIYFSKLNMNSNIYELYDDPQELEKCLHKIYSKLNDKGEYIIIQEYLKENEDTGKCEKKKTVESIYCFGELVRDPETSSIYGKMIRRKPHFTEEFIPRTRTTEKRIDENDATSVFFYFDVKNQIIAFFTRVKLGYNQFNDAFRYLMNEQFEEFSVEIFLQKNFTQLEESLKKFETIYKIKSTLIPPNLNRDKFDKMFQDDSEEMKESGITKKTVEYESNKKTQKGIKKSSNIFQRTIAGVESGYGTLKIDGLSKDNKELSFDVDRDAAFTLPIKDKDKDEKTSFIDRVKTGISQILAQNTIEKFNEVDVKDESKE